MQELREQWQRMTPSVSLSVMHGQSVEKQTVGGALPPLYGSQLFPLEMSQYILGEIQNCEDCDRATLAGLLITQILAGTVARTALAVGRAVNLINVFSSNHIGKRLALFGITLGRIVWDCSIGLIARLVAIIFAAIPGKPCKEFSHWILKKFSIIDLHLNILEARIDCSCRAFLESQESQKLPILLEQPPRPQQQQTEGAIDLATNPNAQQQQSSEPPGYLAGPEQLA